MAYYFFDPIYHEGNVIGYSLAFKRRLPTFNPEFPTVAGTLPGLEEAVVVWAIEQFKIEGKESLYLGLMPLCRK